MNEDAARPILSTFIEGTPAPKGSVEAYTYRRPDGGMGARVVHRRSGGQPEFTAALIRVFREAMRGRPVETGPVEVVLEFYLPRPPTVPRSRLLPAVKPDLDKLVRLVLDALTRWVIVDDGRVTDLRACKRYAGPDQAPGVRVVARPATTVPEAPRQSLSP